MNAIKVPSNHCMAERQLIALVRSGEWEIDADGCVWRVAIRTGDPWHNTFRIVLCKRRRAEKMAREYLMVRAMFDGNRVCGAAHRLVWQNLHGNIPDGLTINHKNGIKTDNRPSNLELATYSEQMSHANRMRLRDQRGEGNPQVKLTNADVAAIRQMYSSGEWTMERLGERFGVTFQHVSVVVRGRSRAEQGGPVQVADLRHSVCVHDPVTGRFVASLDGRVWNQFPEVRR